MHKTKNCDDCPVPIQMAEVFKALGDVNRLYIIGILASDKYDRVCVTDLAKKLEITQPATSQHLRTLKNVRIIESMKEGNFIYYRFSRDTLIEYKAHIDDLFNQVLNKCKNSK
jgi:DNA-binding transcriptional ArsR family regulator